MFKAHLEEELNAIPSCHTKRTYWKPHRIIAQYLPVATHLPDIKKPVESNYYGPSLR